NPRRPREGREYGEGDDVGAGPAPRSNRSPCPRRERGTSMRRLAALVAGAMLLSVASAQYYPHDYNSGAFEFTVYPKFPTKISVDVTQAGAYQVVIPKEYLYPGFAFSIQIEVQNDSDRPVRLWSGTSEERLEGTPNNGDAKLVGGPVD